MSLTEEILSQLCEKYTCLLYKHININQQSIKTSQMIFYWNSSPKKFNLPL